MTQFGGSFRFVQLPAVTQLLAELRSTGRLCIAHAEWTGEIVVREGEIVEARLGAERGRAALEAIVVALPDGEFSFTDEPVADASEPLVTAAERTAVLDRMGDEQQRLAKLMPSLGLVPRLVETLDGYSADTQVTIGASALQLIPSLVLGHTLEQVARDRGLVRTLRDVAALMDGGLVKLEPKPNIPTDEPPVEKPVAAPPAPVQRLSRPFAARPSAGARAVAIEESTQPAVAHQNAPRLSWARRLPPPAAVQPPPAAVQPPPAAVQPPPAAVQPPAVIPPGVVARLAAARTLTVEPTAPPRSAMPQPAHFAGWRNAVVSFFLNDEK